MASVVVSPNPLPPNVSLNIDSSSEWASPRKAPLSAPPPSAARCRACTPSSVFGASVKVNVATLVITAVFVTVGVVTLALFAARVGVFAPSPSTNAATFLPSALLPNSVSFIALGDWGREGNAAQLLPVPAMAAWATQMKALGKLQFVLSVGDNFYDGPTTEEGGDLSVRTWKAGFLEVYNAPALVDTEWLVIQGNHDYMGELKFQLGWGERMGRFNPDAARWHAPSLNFTRTFSVAGSGAAAADDDATPPPSASSCVAFVMIDTCPFITSYLQYDSTSEPRRVLMYQQLLEQSNASQLAWLYTEINAAAARCPNVAVVGHHPILGGGRHALNPLQTDLRTRFHLDDFFREVGVDIYINGHDHLLMHSEASETDTTYVLSGAASNIRVGEMEENAPTPTTRWWAEVGGFTVHSMNSTHTMTSYVGAAGTVLHSVFRPVRAKNPNCPTCNPAAQEARGVHAQPAVTARDLDEA